MNELIWVKIENDNYYKLLLKINRIEINIFEIKKYKDYILIKITYKDYKKIKKYLISYKIYVYDKIGINKFKELIKKYFVFTIGIILGIVFLLLINNIIFKIEIKSNNKDIVKLIEKELDIHGIGTLKLKKSHDKIEIIVNDILENNKNTLEWLEIKYDGLIMIVNVTEKIGKEIKNEYDNCNIVASKDAKISSLNIYRGIPLKEINDYVLKGNIILSGSIIHNEELKNTVCADGEIYGEVWYKVKIEVPFQETYKEYTGKKRYNFNIVFNDNTYNIFKSRLNIFDKEIINLYKLNDFEINFVKEKAYIEKTKKLSVDDAYNKGLALVEEKINLMLEDEEEILLKKVLKKDVNNSTIYLEIFIVTKENIGVLQVVEEE